MKYLLLTLLLASQSYGVGYQKSAPTTGFSSASKSAFGSPEYSEQDIEMGVRFVELKLVSSDIKTLATTPVLAVTSPGDGKALMPVAVLATADYGGVAYTTAAGTIDVEYGGNKSGQVAMSIPNAFLKATSDSASMAVVSNGTNPLNNYGLYVHMTGSNPTAGTHPIFLRIYYRVVPFLLND